MFVRVLIVSVALALAAASVVSTQGSGSSRTVDTHVAELRRKLEAEPARPAHILTVRKVGYRLAP
jgi:DNA-binding response OmpR family regulator